MRDLCVRLHVKMTHKSFIEVEVWIEPLIVDARSLHIQYFLCVAYFMTHYGVEVVRRSAKLIIILFILRDYIMW